MNVLITGQAGCGKTSLLKTICTSLMKENKIVAMTASTGIAATQFESRMTLHKWAGVQVCIH